MIQNKSTDASNGDDNKDPHEEAARILSQELRNFGIKDDVYIASRLVVRLNAANISLGFKYGEKKGFVT